MNLRVRLCVCFEAHEINEDSKKLQDVTIDKSKPIKRKSDTTDIVKKSIPKKKQRSTTRLAGKLAGLSSSDSESNEDEDLSSDSETKTKKKPVKLRSSKKSTEDTEYEEKERSKNVIKRKPTLKKSNSKILSSDEVTEVARTSNPKECRETCSRNYWIEVYLEEENVWQPVDPMSTKTNLVGEYFEKRFEKQILYACVFDNDNRIKDVTKRYSSKWTTSTRVLRVDFVEKKLWWEKTLLLKQTLDADLDIEEEKHLKSMLMNAFNKAINL